MKKLITKLVIIELLTLAGVSHANGKIIRATEIGTALWSDITHGKFEDTIIEIRQGDELPVSFEANGDLLESKQSIVNYVGIKKNFWLKVNHSNIEISFDGLQFKKISNALTGSIQIGTGSEEIGGIANSINFIFKAFLKK